MLYIFCCSTRYLNACKGFLSESLKQIIMQRAKGKAQDARRYLKPETQGFKSLTIGKGWKPWLVGC
ncbi:MAG: hypothetical protein B6D64_00690 [Bacteroidetes bacterium 4484_276]|nr:MAG: hypothetical protein B6D64_00690 [Bacteroidetes bacterium 4484_276]